MKNMKHIMDQYWRISQPKKCEEPCIGREICNLLISKALKPTSSGNCSSLYMRKHSQHFRKPATWLETKEMGAFQMCGCLSAVIRAVLITGECKWHLYVVVNSEQYFSTWYRGDNDTCAGGVDRTSEACCVALKSWPVSSLVVFNDDGKDH